jgi:HK97 family phage prohead protease
MSVSSPTVQGYVVVWGDVAEVEYGLTESFAPNAFDEPMTGPLYVAHRPGTRYASVAGKTLSLEQDAVGLRFEAHGDWNDPDWRALVNSIRGGLRGCSFGFYPVAQSGHMVYRARLREITLTGAPAYEGGGVWLSDEDQLPAKLALVRACWSQPSRTQSRPGPQAAACREALPYVAAWRAWSGDIRARLGRNLLRYGAAR